MSRQILVVSLRTGFLIGAVAILEFLCRTGIVPRLTLIPPSEMAMKLWSDLLAGSDTADMLFTVTNVAAASAISVAAGIVLGSMVHAAPRLRRLLDPLLASYYSVPTFVFYPVLIVLFGITRWSLIAIGALFGIVVMMMNVISGLDRVPRILIKAARSFNMGPIETLWRIKFPAAAPSLFTGLKLAVTYSVIGVVAGEFILSVAGLGKHIKLAYDNLDNPSMYASLLLLLGIVVVLYLVVHGMERAVYRRWSA